MREDRRRAINTNNLSWRNSLRTLSSRLKSKELEGDMANPRTSIEDLKLQGAKGNLKRALARPAVGKLEKREDILAMWDELMERRKEALQLVKAEGLLLKQDKFGPKGELYWQWIKNPMLKVAQETERQLASLARMLTEGAQEGERPKEKSPMEQLDEMLRKPN
jgi:hypothetical protein